MRVCKIFVAGEEVFLYTTPCVNKQHALTLPPDVG